MICSFIDQQRHLGRRVETVCQILREQGLAAAPRTYRAWRDATAGPSQRDLGDAVIVDRLRGLRTAGPAGRAVPEILYGRRKMTVWLN